MDMRSTFLNWHLGFETRCWRRAVARVNGYPLPVRATHLPSSRLAGSKAMHPCFPEKHRATETPAVPKPTQVGGYKNTKARERNLVKELGKIAP